MEYEDRIWNCKDKRGFMELVRLVKLMIELEGDILCLYLE